MIYYVCVLGCHSHPDVSRKGRHKPKYVVTVQYSTVKEKSALEKN